MELQIRPMRYDERKYTYAQSTQLKGQTGSIGRLRGDFGSGGTEFWTTWEDHNPDLKTDEFKAELDDVINALRSEEYGLLKDRRGMMSFARTEPDSAMKGNYTTEYGFRVDTDKHAFLIRCNPQQGDYNIYCFCYVSKWLDRHIERAANDIRFVDSGYKELFRLPDGEQITVVQADGARKDYLCRYIDEAHLEVGGDLYHIGEFAERMERCGATYASKEEPLPRECLSTLPSTGEVIKIDRYQKGYTPRNIRKTPQENRDLVDQSNARRGISKAQEAAMLAGSMFGWDAPAAKPKNYDRDGKPIKPKDKER
jgi:hypothetical protein